MLAISQGMKLARASRIVAAMRTDLAQTRERMVAEQVWTVNTAAAGGNASLMSLTPD